MANDNEARSDFKRAPKSLAVSAAYENMESKNSLVSHKIIL
jgi:hypothetical protein